MWEIYLQTAAIIALESSLYSSAMRHCNYSVKKNARSYRLAFFDWMPTFIIGQLLVNPNIFGISKGYRQHLDEYWLWQYPLYLEK